MIEKLKYMKSMNLNEEKVPSEMTATRWPMAALASLLSETAAFMGTTRLMATGGQTPISFIINTCGMIAPGFDTRNSLKALAPWRLSNFSFWKGM